MKIDFKSKVQALSAKEIIMAMVEGLKNPYTKIEMGTFGYKDSKGVCYGCAATNTICTIIGENRLLEGITGSQEGPDDRWRSAIGQMRFVGIFEDAIDFLRMGFIGMYNDKASILGISAIDIPEGVKMPHLTSYFTEEELNQYVLLANSQE